MFGKYRLALNRDHPMAREAIRSELCAFTFYHRPSNKLMFEVIKARNAQVATLGRFINHSEMGHIVQIYYAQNKVRED